jgi:hypothetical protein
MNKVLIFLAFIIIIASCKKSTPSDDGPDKPIFANDDWNRIRIPDGGEALAVAGSIDDTLLVTTLYNTYIVTNSGTRFTVTDKNLNRTPGLLVVQDTIYAFRGDHYDGDYKRHFATFPSYFTLDKGKTWYSNVPKPSYTNILIGKITTKRNVTYEIDLHRGPDKNGSGINYVLQTTITKTENGIKSMFKHPVEAERPINLYLDNKERLYITTGGYFNDAGVYMSPSALSPTYIYVSKNSVQ